EGRRDKFYSKYESRHFHTGHCRAHNNGYCRAHNNGRGGGARLASTLSHRIRGGLDGYNLQLCTCCV
ncbi:hypothetical protein L9F63_000661, partial [Diploptera punctata]